MGLHRDLGRAAGHCRGMEVNELHCEHGPGRYPDVSPDVWARADRDGRYLLRIYAAVLSRRSRPAPPRRHHPSDDSPGASARAGLRPQVRPGPHARAGNGRVCRLPSGHERPITQSRGDVAGATPHSGAAGRLYASHRRGFGGLPLGRAVSRETAAPPRRVRLRGAPRRPRTRRSSAWAWARIGPMALGRCCATRAPSCTPARGRFAAELVSDRFRCGGHREGWWRYGRCSGSLGRLSVCRIPASTFNTCTTLLLQKYCSRFSPKEVG